jgi:hypothetical protein
VAKHPLVGVDLRTLASTTLELKALRGPRPRSAKRCAPAGPPNIPTPRILAQRLLAARFAPRRRALFDALAPPAKAALALTEALEALTGPDRLWIGRPANATGACSRP